MISPYYRSFTMIKLLVVHQCLPNFTQISHYFLLFKHVNHNGPSGGCYCLSVQDEFAGLPPLPAPPCTEYVTVVGLTIAGID